MNQRQTRIEELLSTLEPRFILVEDESHNHHVPENAQSHFKVTIVCEQFNTMRLIKRHQIINKLLANEFATGMHALSIHTYSIEQWQKRNQVSRQSPSCKDGYAK